MIFLIWGVSIATDDIPIMELNKAMLTKILEQLIQAFNQTRTVQRYKLKNGLHITLYGTSTDKYKLILWRDKVFPSQQEWETVLKFWPYPVPKSEGLPVKQQSVYTLRGEVPTQTVMQGHLF